MNTMEYPQSILRPSEPQLHEETMNPPAQFQQAQSVLSGGHDPIKRRGITMPIWGAILLAIVIVVIIIACIAFYLKTRALSKRLDEVQRAANRKILSLQQMQASKPSAQVPTQQNLVPISTGNDEESQRFNQLEQEAKEAGESFDENANIRPEMEGDLADL